MNTKLALATAALAIMAVGPAAALEVTAGGSLDVQTNWAALKNLVDAANGRIATIQTDLGQVSKTVSGLTSRMDSVEGTVGGISTNVESFKNCGASGYVSTGSGCRKAATNISVSTGSCFAPSAQNVGSWSESGAGAVNKFYCPNGSFLSSAVFEGPYVRSFECCYLKVSQ